MTVVDRGEVWWGPALFKDGNVYRPWLVLSDNAHPFSTQECLAVGLTTTPHDVGIRIDPEDWTDGGSSRQSYLSPWYCTTTKQSNIDRYQGTLMPTVVDQVANELARYIGASNHQE